MNPYNDYYDTHTASIVNFQIFFSVTFQLYSTRSELHDFSLG